MRSLTALWSLLLAGPVVLSAQTSKPLCYHARPKPACSAFVLTSFGGYVLLGRDDLGDAPYREVADWGAMVNVGAKDAVGASVFASLDRSGLTLGPAARYRRWLSASASIEVALGTPLVTSTGDVRPGSLFGLIKWNANDWFSVAARPEVLRWTTVTGCVATACSTVTRFHPRLSVGLEIGRIPGAVLTGLSGVATYLVALAVANSD